MDLQTWLTLVAALAAVGAAGFGYLAWRGAGAVEGTTGSPNSELVRAGEAAAELRDSATDHGGGTPEWLDVQAHGTGGQQVLEVHTGALDACLLRLEQVEVLPETPSGLPSWIPPTLSALVQHLPRNVSASLSRGQWVVTFPSETLAALRSGQATLMTTKAGETLPKAVSTTTGQVASNARVVGRGGAVASVAALSGPALGLIALAGAAAYAHQQWLEQTLNRIDQQVLALGQRLRDDDHGRLEAAVNVACSCEEILGRGPLTQTHVNRLSQAKLEADAIYYSRRRFVRRFLDILEQADTAQDKNQDGPWTTEAVAAFQDPGRFQAEVSVYLHALVARARVGGTLVSELAAEGYGPEGLHELAVLRDELLDDFWPFWRRLRALANHPATGPVKSRRTRGHQRVAQQLHEAGEDTLVPLMRRDRDNPELTDLRLPLKSGLGEQ